MRPYLNAPISIFPQTPCLPKRQAKSRKTNFTNGQNGPFSKSNLDQEWSPIDAKGLDKLGPLVGSNFPAIVRDFVCMLLRGVSSRVQRTGLLRGLLWDHLRASRVTCIVLHGAATRLERHGRGRFSSVAHPCGCWPRERRWLGCMKEKKSERNTCGDQGQYLCRFF